MEMIGTSSICGFFLSLEGLSRTTSYRRVVVIVIASKVLELRRNNCRWADLPTAYLLAPGQQYVGRVICSVRVSTRYDL